MSQSQQLVLKVASTIGETFSLKMLTDVIMAQGGITGNSKQSFTAEDLKNDLKVMETQGLIARNTKDIETSYFFMNSLIKDVIYGQMLFSQRRQIHHIVARMLLKYFADNTAYHPILAYHFKQAEEDEKALYFYTKAGTLSLMSYANQEAVTFFQEAIQLIAKLRSQRTLDDIVIERKLGQAYYNLGQYL
jgi:predicted ATPase